MILIYILFVGYLVAVVSALYTNSKLKKKGYTGIPNKECWYPSKHFSYAVGFFISLIPHHVLIQYAIRFATEKCRDCQKKGFCLDFHGNKTCGCDPYKMACSPFEKCKNGNYLPIIWNKKKAWEYINSINPNIIFNNKN